MLLLLSCLVFAADIRTDGELRLIGSLPPDIPVDAIGTTVGQGFVLDSRVRAGLDLSGDTLRMATELDVLSGQLLGDTWDIPGDALGDERRRDALDAASVRGISPRELHLGWRPGKVDLQLGLTTSRWGMGMLANDGAEDPLFGRVDQGDRVIRARVATTPITRSVPDDPSDTSALYVIGAFDLVVQDEFARLWQDQRAFQGVLSTLWSGHAGHRLGAYFVARRQTEPDREPDHPRATAAWIGDITGALPLPVGDWTLRLEGEAAGIIGRTSRALTYNASDGLAIASAGAAGELRLEAPDRRFTGWLRGGWASADGDPDDGTTQDFAFDANYDVGMVLFDEVGGAIEAGTYALLTDPQYSGQPPDGVEAIPTEGSFRRATYLQPAIGGRPVSWLELRGGAVFAWSTGPIAQPFYTFRAGGEPRNATDQPTTGRALGTELDWAMILGRDDAEWALRPQVLVQGGHALLSDDLAGTGPSVATMLMSTARARW